MEKKLIRKGLKVVFSWTDKGPLQHALFKWYVDKAQPLKYKKLAEKVLFGLNVAGNSCLTKEELLDAAIAYGMKKVGVSVIAELFYAVDRSGKGFIPMADFLPICVSNYEIF